MNFHFVPRLHLILIVKLAELFASLTLKKTDNECQSIWSILFDGFHLWARTSDPEICQCPANHKKWNDSDYIRECNSVSIHSSKPGTRPMTKIRILFFQMPCPGFFFSPLFALPIKIAFYPRLKASRLMGSSNFRRCIDFMVQWPACPNGSLCLNFDYPQFSRFRNRLFSPGRRTFLKSLFCDNQGK